MLIVSRQLVWNHLEILGIVYTYITYLMPALDWKTFNVHRQPPSGQVRTIDDPIGDENPPTS